MKHLLVLLGLVGLLAKTSFAYPPMEQLPLQERVERASDVFIGVIEKVIVVDEDEQEITDDKLIPDLVNSILLQVRVEESLTSPKWLPAKSVIVGYGGLWMRIKDDRDAYIGKKSIFITNIEHLRHWGPIFVPSYGYFLTEPVEKKAEIQKLVKTKLEGTHQWNDFDQLAQYLRDSEVIQPGMTRAKVGKLLNYATGISETKNKYVFKKSPYVALDIEFTRRLTTRTDELDTVVSVSKPYLEWPKR